MIRLVLTVEYSFLSNNFPVFFFVFIKKIIVNLGLKAEKMNTSFIIGYPKIVKSRWLRFRLFTIV